MERSPCEQAQEETGEEELFFGQGGRHSEHLTTLQVKQTITQRT